MREVYKAASIAEHKRSLGFSDRVDNLALLEKISTSSTLFGPMASMISKDKYFLSSFEPNGILFMGYNSVSGNFTGNDYLLPISDFSTVTFKKSKLIAGRLLFNAEKMSITDTHGTTSDYIYSFYYAGTDWIKGTKDKVHEIAASYPKLAQKSDSSVGTNADSIQDLRELKALLDDGILTQEEFDAKKKQILNL